MIIFGKQSFLYLLEKYPKLILKVFFSKEVDSNIFKKVSKLGVEIIRVDNKKAQALAGGGNHQGFFAEIAPFKLSSIEELKNLDSLVVLSGVEDIGNIGQIIRTSLALGVGGLIIADRKELNDKAIEGIIRSSSAAFLSAKVGFIQNSLDLVNILKAKDFTLIGTSKDKKEDASLYKAKKWALFLGSEHLGLKNRLFKSLDGSFSIKMHNGFDSINVAMAGGILIDRLKNSQL